MRFGIIIQARTDSERFPKKCLQLIEDKPMLWHVINRCKKMNLPIVLATTTRDIDEPLVKIAIDSKIDCFCGSTNDVLDRYYKAAKKFSFDVILRITGDCPLIDPNQSLRIIEPLKHGADFAGLSIGPEGLSTEGFTFSVLEKAWKNAKLKSHREHVTPYILDPKNKFKKITISEKEKFKNFRWVVDYPDDLEFVKKVYSEFNGNKEFSREQILKLLKEKPNIAKINSLHPKFEGYLKTLIEDGYKGISDSDIDRISIFLEFLYKKFDNKSNLKKIFNPKIGISSTILACYLIKFYNLSVQESINKIKNTGLEPIKTKSQKQLILKFFGLEKK